jgi:hypothetical protein
MYKVISSSIILITALFLVTSIEVSAQDLTFFNDQVSFNNSCPDLAFEDFEDTNVPPNSSQGCPNPFNSLTNNLCYSPGALITGFSLSAPNPTNPGMALSVLTPNNSGVTNVAVGPLTTPDDTEITFTELVKAVGMVLVSNRGNTTVDVRVFGEGNVLLGIAIVNITPTNGTFLGVLAADTTITRVELVETGESKAELLYELSFGRCVIADVPTLSEWGLIAMAGILGIVGFMVLRRRKVTA